VVVATNQSGVGRGLFDMDTLNQIHARCTRRLVALGGRIDAIFYCPHAADSNCDCRKPKPGMFKRISETLNVDLTGVPAIGDSLRDLQACALAGCRPMLVLTGKGEKTRAEGNLPAGTLEFADLAAAVDGPHLAKEKNERHPFRPCSWPGPSFGRCSPRRWWSSAPSLLRGIWGYPPGQALAPGHSMGRREPARHPAQGDRP
jgi:HAD superfamily hydrolase (TIGR01662 family)